MMENKVVEAGTFSADKSLFGRKCEVIRPSSSMDELSKRTKIVHERILPHLTQLKEIKAVVIGGSVAYKLVDQYSDIDFFIYCDRIPDEKNRALTIRQLREKSLIQGVIINAFSQTVDVFRLNGVEIMFIFRTLAEQEEIIERSKKEPETISTIDLAWLANIQYSLLAYDPNNVVKNWRRKLDYYPMELKISQLRQCCLVLFDLYEASWAAWARGDFTYIVYHIGNSVNMIGQILFALNNKYFPGFKGTLEHIDMLEKKVHNSFDRLTTMLNDTRESTDYSEIYRELGRYLIDLRELLKKECEKQHMSLDFPKPFPEENILMRSSPAKSDKELSQEQIRYLS